jgi:hypothetical protein
LGPGCLPEPPLLEKLVHSMAVSGADVLTCCATMTGKGKGAPAFAYQPLGRCLESGIFVNLYGAGCLLLKAKLVPQALGELRRLLDPQRVWGALAELGLKGRDCDVVPEFRVRLPARIYPLTVVNMDYDTRTEMLRLHNSRADFWLAGLLDHIMGAERRTMLLEQELEERRRQIKAMNRWAPGVIVYKVQRETKRLVKQCRGLFGRNYE